MVDLWTAPAVQRHEGSLLDPEPQLLRGLLDWHRSTFEDLDPSMAEADYARLVTEQQAAREAVEGVPLDHVFELPDGDKFPVRLLFIHMIGEYARHNGHADLLRQRVDGVTGA